MILTYILCNPNTKPRTDIVPVSNDRDIFYQAQEAQTAAQLELTIPFNESENMLDTSLRTMAHEEQDPVFRKILEVQMYMKMKRNVASPVDGFLSENEGT
jgi:hypothetical protein